MNNLNTSEVEIDDLLVENASIAEEHYSLALKIANSSNPKSFTQRIHALDKKLVEHIDKLSEFPAVHRVMEQKLVELRLLICAKDLVKK